MSTSELACIISQFDQAFDKDPWYGDPIYSILESVDPNLVFEAPKPGVHSIAELIAHIITYREFTIKRLEGDNDYFTGQEESFLWQRICPDQREAWKHLIEKLETDHRTLVSKLQQSNDKILNKTVGGKSYSFRYLLNGIIQHDTYHLGQIVLIQKMQQNNYQAKPGLLNYSYKLFPFKNLSLLK